MKIPDEVRKCVAYLYVKTNKNLDPVGTVFFVGFELEHWEGNALSFLSCSMYAITSRHVIEAIRERQIDQKTHFAMNGTDGNVTWLELPISDWQFPSGQRSDVAIAEIDFDRSQYDHLCFPNRGFLSHAVLGEWGIGPSDDVYFAGLSTRRPGSPANIPIIRVGSIAALPAGVIKTRHSDINAYLVEAHSIGGLSGSPVFYSHGTSNNTYSRTYEPPNVASGLYLLGYIQGHFDEVVHGDKFNMGIALVVPADEILAALEYPPFVANRTREFEKDREQWERRPIPTERSTRQAGR